MISVALEKRICTLLDEGELSQRKIARVTGISRSTVAAIANGTRPQKLGKSSEDGVEFFSMSHRPRRCPQCGGLVFMPCHLCRVRAYAVRENTPRRGSPPRATQPANDDYDPSASVSATAAAAFDFASGASADVESQPVSPTSFMSGMSAACCPPASGSLTSF